MNKLSPVVFGAVLICFFLPFVNVSCQGQRVASFSGMQLVTGTTIEQPGMFGPAQKKKVDGEKLAIFSFISAIVGLFFYFFGDKAGHVASAIAGGSGAVTLFLLKSKLDKDILQQVGGMIQLEYGPGFYLAAILFVAAAGINAYLAMQGQEVTQQISNSTLGSNFCNQCGAKINSGAAFCSECGHSLK